MTEYITKFILDPLIITFGGNLWVSELYPREKIDS